MTTTICPVPYLAHIVPSDEGQLQAQAMENWFQACASDDPFALELVGTQRQQGFVLRTISEAQLAMLSQQFQAQYPQAEIYRISPDRDPLRISPGEQALVGDFALARPCWLPLKMFSGKALAEPGNDPLANLLAAMEPVEPGVRIISQLALVRAPEYWIASAIRKAVEHPLQEERDAFAASLQRNDTAYNAQGWRLLMGIVSILGGVYGYHWYHTHTILPLVLFLLIALAGLLWWRIKSGQRTIYDMKLVAEKLVRAAFYMQLRVIVIGPQEHATESTLRAHLANMQVAYRQFSLASANSLYLRRVHRLSAFGKQADTLRSARYAFPYHHPLGRWLHRGWSKDICNGLELSGMYHLPQEFTDLPLVTRSTVKHLLFSPEVAAAIERHRNLLPPVPLGISRHRGHAVRVSLPFETLLSHKVLIGRSRYGKSVLIQLLVSGILHPVYDGLPPGIFCIDPHRDLIFDILTLIPSHRTKDVLLLDFTEHTHIVGLNPLDASMGLSRDQAIASLMSCFERIWEKYWGPRMAFFLKNICLLLFTLNATLCVQGRAQEQYTLLDINPLLQHRDYATLVLHQLDSTETWHQELLAWFQHTYWTLPLNSSFRQEIIMPILSKMSVFTDNVQLRRIFSQSVTTARVHQAITEGKIVLCALSSRDMDESSVNILGSTLINTLHYAFTRQQDSPLTQRRKCAVFIDELQNFSGSAFDKLLSEDAKWGCAAGFTTQNLKRLNQIKDGLQEMLLSNCENLFAFNVSAADAELLEAELQEKVTQKHIISQPRLHCYARISIPRYPLQFTSITLAHPVSWNPSSAHLAQAQEIQHKSQAQFKHATEIDQLYAVHLQQFLDVSLFADRMKNDAESIQKNRQRKKEVTQDKIAHFQDTKQQEEALQSSAIAVRNTQQEQKDETKSAGDGTKKASGHTRSHPRSRRITKLKGKSSVGTPTPGLTQTEASENE